MVCLHTFGNGPLVVWVGGVDFRDPLMNGIVTEGVHLESQTNHQPKPPINHQLTALKVT